MAVILGAHFVGGIVGFGVLTVAAMLIGLSVAGVSDAVALSLRQRESVIGVNTLPRGPSGPDYGPGDAELPLLPALDLAERPSCWRGRSRSSTTGPSRPHCGRAP